MKTNSSLGDYFVTVGKVEVYKAKCNVLNRFVAIKIGRASCRERV